MRACTKARVQRAMRFFFPTSWSDVHRGRERGEKRAECAKKFIKVYGGICCR